MKACISSSPARSSPCRGKASRKSRASGTRARWRATASHSPIEGSDAELTEQLESLLQDAVGRRMIADVPLGAFLSGGINSSTVVALMQAATQRHGEDLLDRLRHSRLQRSASCGRGGAASSDRSHRAHGHANEALDVIPRLPEFYDEPFADSSQIPTYLVSAMTRKHVTVALSGDGGDELFAGYNRYQLTQRFWRSLSLMPRAVRKGAAAALTAVRPDRWTRFSRRCRRGCARRKPATKCIRSPPCCGSTAPTRSIAASSAIGSRPRSCRRRASRRAFSMTKHWRRTFPICCRACNFSIWSPICPTTF